MSNNKELFDKCDEKGCDIYVGDTFYFIKNKFYCKSCMKENFECEASSFEHFSKYSKSLMEINC